MVLLFFLIFFPFGPHQVEIRAFLDDSLIITHIFCKICLFVRQQKEPQVSSSKDVYKMFSFPSETHFFILFVLFSPFYFHPHRQKFLYCC